MGHVKPDPALHTDRGPRGVQRGRREPHVIDIDYFHFPKPNSETSVGLAEVNKRLSGRDQFRHHRRREGPRGD